MNQSQVRQRSSLRGEMLRRFSVEALEDRELLTVYTVVNTLDFGPGSLRQAIDLSNADTGTATNTINFNIPGGGVKTINVSTDYAAITHPVNINGASQPGYSNSPVVTIKNYADAPADTDAFFIRASNTTIQGLAINNFKLDAVVVYGATGVSIVNDYIGVAADGATLKPNGNGVLLVAGAQNTIVSNDVVSGNLGRGIVIDGANTSNNHVTGSKIGTSTDGTVGRGNGLPGVTIQNGANNNTIGGTAAGAGNVIAGNKAQGIYIGGNANSNFVEGNYIGVNAKLAQKMGNRFAGVAIWGSSNNTIGGTAPGAGNTITGNTGNGVRIDSGSNGNLVEGNVIGSNQSGAPTSNAEQGVLIRGGSANNVIGGATSAAGNQILNQRLAGVRLDNAGQGNVIENDLFQYNGYYAPADHGDGVDVFNTPGVSVSNSKFVQNRDYGIFASSSPNFTQTGNTFSKNGKATVKVV